MFDGISPEALPKRIQRKRSKGWRMPENTVCVDRTSIFGNPFPITKSTMEAQGKKSDTWCVGTWNGPALWFFENKVDAVDCSIRAFKEWLMQPSQSILRDKARLALRGKNLACWCKEGTPCHADILLDVVNCSV